MIHCDANSLHDATQLIEDLLSGETHYCESLTNQILRPPEILLSDILEIVNIAIDFNDKTSRDTAEVNNERSDAVLATNRATKLVATKSAPEDYLSSRLPLPKITCCRDSPP